MKCRKAENNNQGNKMSTTSKFKTLFSVCFSAQNGPDQRASGWITSIQVRRTPSGGYLKRKMDSNGKYNSVGPPERITEEEAMRLLALASKR